MQEKVEMKLTDENFKEEVLKSQLPVLVDFWAPWCMPCHMIAPTVEEIAREYKDKLKVCKVNVDEASKTASGYGIMSIPALAVFRNGELAHKIVGAVPKQVLENEIKPYI